MGDGEAAVGAAELAFAGQEAGIGVVGAVDDDGAFAGAVVGIFQEGGQAVAVDAKTELAGGRRSR